MAVPKTMQTEFDIHHRLESFEGHSLLEWFPIIVMWWIILPCDMWNKIIIFFTLWISYSTPASSDIASETPGAASDIAAKREITTSAAEKSEKSSSPLKGAAGRGRASRPRKVKEEPKETPQLQGGSLGKIKVRKGRRCCSGAWKRYLITQAGFSFRHSSEKTEKLSKKLNNSCKNLKVSGTFLMHS